RQVLNQFETHRGFCHVLHLGGPDLVMNLAHGLVIGCSDNGGHGERVPSLATLNIGQHVHLLKEDEVLAALATCLQGFVLLDTFPLSVGPSASLPAGPSSFEDEKPASACRSTQVKQLQHLDIPPSHGTPALACCIHLARTAARTETQAPA